LHKIFTFDDSFIDTYIFADFGEVFSTFPERTTLASAGIGISMPFTQHVRLDLSAAVPLRNNVLPNQSEFEGYAALVLDLL